MTFQQYELRFREKATLSGYSEDNVVKCLLYAKPLIEKNLPVIYNTSNLSALVGYKKNYIKKAVLFTDYFYRTFSIKKKNGSLRILKEPLPSLKEIQYWILNNILSNIAVSRFAKAYIKDRNILDNVKYHRGKNMVVNLDIDNFFSSIRRVSIEKLFLSLGYSSNISNLLSKLCCCDECLPQGAPTSPYLSNIFMLDFDEKLSKYCTERQLRFTRYADDITVSGDVNSEKLIEFVVSILANRQMKLNSQKINVLSRNERQTVTGIVVNDIIQVPKFKRDEIRQEIYFIKKFGLETHLQNTNNKWSNYLKHLLGKINFVLFVNSKDKSMQAYKEYIGDLLSSETINDK